jgi:hypothetical protein
VRHAQPAAASTVVPKYMVPTDIGGTTRDPILTVIVFVVMTPPCNLEAAAGWACLDAAFEAGARFFDTANNYAFWAGGVGDESETVLGDWFTARSESNSCGRIAARDNPSMDSKPAPAWAGRAPILVPRRSAR